MRRLAPLLLAALVGCSTPEPKEKSREVTWYDKVLILMGEGKRQEALAVVDEVLKEEPGNPWALANRGTVLMNMGRHDEAVVAFLKALEREPKSTHLLTNLAMAHWRQGLFPAALSWADKALESDPAFPAALAVKGATLRDMGRKTEGDTLLKAAYQLEPSLENEFEFPSFRFRQ